MDVFCCISSIIGKKHLVIEWLSWVPNNSGFINYNVSDTLADICSTPLELVGGSSDFPVDNFVGSKRFQSGRVKFSKVQGFDNF